MPDLRHHRWPRVPTASSEGCESGGKNMTTNLDDAGRDILDMLRILECKMRAKGWEKARARLAMRPTAMDIHLEAANYDVAAFLDPLDCRIRYAFAYGETLSEIFEIG